MRDEIVFPVRGNEITTGETWNIRNRAGHWYEASTEFAKQHLGLGNGRSCLVIGSPIFEAIALREQGWDVTYMDVRKPPEEAGKRIVCDAVDIRLPDESFDAISTACVLTHAGTGRYGDGENMEHGDEAMLGHIARVLKSGCMAVITFGAVADIPRMARVGTMHRIYTVPECLRMLAAAALKVGEMRIWSHATKAWLAAGEKLTTDIGRPDYISFMVTK